VAGAREETQKVVVVSGPKGFDPSAALFDRGIEISQDDVVVAIERPGNVSVEILEEDSNPGNRPG
jgi:hypothetical protein